MLTLFDHKQRKVVDARFGKRGKYKHSFGGQWSDYGLSVVDDLPLHLIGTFDTSDPKWPVPTRRRFFPLCYGFAFGGVPTAYRLQGRKVHVISPNKPTLDPNYPYDNYPPAYESRRLVLKRIPYDPRDPGDALMHSAFFGLSHVPDATLNKVSKRLEEFGEWDCFDFDEQERLEFLKRHPSNMPLLQDIPDNECVNPNCSEYEKPGAMNIVAFHMEGNSYDFSSGAKERLNETELWGPDIGMIQLVFQMCKTCGTIVVSNQST